MKVCILASLSSEQERDNIQRLAHAYMQKGYFVIYPFPKPDVPRQTIFLNYLRNIDKADKIVVLTKSDGTIGDGVAYEMAFAEYLVKPITIFRPDEERGFVCTDAYTNGLVKN